MAFHHWKVHNNVIYKNDNDHMNLYSMVAFITSWQNNQFVQMNFLASSFISLVICDLKCSILVQVASITHFHIIDFLTLGINVIHAKTITSWPCNHEFINM